MIEPRFDPGSFRDPGCRVFRYQGRILRALDAATLKDWEKLKDSSFFQRLLSQKQIVATRRLRSREEKPWLEEHRVSAVLEHQVLPFISYPYEWGFSMLRDAALFQLNLVLESLEEGITLKDCTPYNVQWMGTDPIFIDIPSFKILGEGEPWVGYRQFCQMFLYPLMLQAYKNVPFQPWLRGALNGINAEDFWHLASLRDVLRPGVLTRVFMMAKAQALYGSTSRDIKSELRESGFHKKLIQNNVRQLRKLIEGLSWKKGESEWSGYEQDNSYSPEDRRRKEDFVRKAAGSRRWNLAWCLGCNAGFFSRILADNAGFTVAMDADPLVIDRLYQDLKKEGRKGLLPLVVDIADLPGGLGWQGLERRSLMERGRPDALQCLALLHHLVLGANIPMNEVIGWFSRLTRHLIIEFVDKKDPMAQKLLINKEDIYPDYNIKTFERLMKRSFRILKKETLSSGTRSLYFAETLKKP